VKPAGENLYALMVVHQDGTRTIFGLNYMGGDMPLPTVMTDKSLMERLVKKITPTLRGLGHSFEVVTYQKVDAKPVKL